MPSTLTPQQFEELAAANPELRLERITTDLAVKNSQWEAELI